MAATKPKRPNRIAPKTEQMQLSFGSTDVPGGIVPPGPPIDRDRGGRSSSSEIPDVSKKKLPVSAKATPESSRRASSADAVVAKLAKPGKPRKHATAESMAKAQREI